jgi:hypothetical protein
MKSFKIINSNVIFDSFTAKEINIQYNMTYDYPTRNFGNLVAFKSPEIDITLTVENSNYNNSYFFNLSLRKINSKASDYKFDIISSEFNASGCRINEISVDSVKNSLIVNIVSDYSFVKSLQERRDEIIDELLNETSNNKNI